MTYRCIICGEPANDHSCEVCRAALCIEHAVEDEAVGVHQCPDCVEAQDEAEVGS